MEFGVKQRFERIIGAFLQVDSEVNHGRAAAIWPRLLHLCYPAMAAMDLAQCLPTLRGIETKICSSSVSFQLINESSLELCVFSWHEVFAAFDAVNFCQSFVAQGSHCVSPSRLCVFLL